MKPHVPLIKFRKGQHVVNTPGLFNFYFNNKLSLFPYEALFYGGRNVVGSLLLAGYKIISFVI